MRRIAVILACTVVAIAATASGAAAHPFSYVSEVPVGRPATVTIGIPSEASVAMTGVDIDIPAGYRVIEPEPPPGWTAVLRGRQLRFGQGKVVPGSFALFSFRGEASRRGPLTFAMVLRNADGGAQRWSGVQGEDQFPAPVVYAGVRAPVRSDDATSPVALAGGGLIAVGVGAVVWRAARRRRNREVGLEPTQQVGAGASHP